MSLKMDLKDIFMNYNVVLGSSSSSRRNVLNLLGISSFYWFSPSIDEDKFVTDEPKTCSISIAKAKMDACLASIDSEETSFYKNELKNPNYLSHKDCDEEQNRTEDPKGNSYQQANSIANLKLNGHMDYLEHQSQPISNTKDDKEKLNHFSDVSYMDIDLIDQRYTNIRAKPSMKECIIICSDQVVHYNNQIRHKPKDLREARRNIEEYSNYDIPIITYSAIVVANTKTKRYFSDVEISKVWYNEIPSYDIEKILDSGKTLYSAGGFLIDDEIMGKYISEIEGYRDAILGLPTHLLEKLLNDLSQSENGWDSDRMKLFEQSP